MDFIYLFQIFLFLFVLLYSRFRFTCHVNEMEHLFLEFELESFWGGDAFLPLIYRYFPNPYRSFCVDAVRLQVTAWCQIIP